MAYELQIFTIFTCRVFYIIKWLLQSRFTGQLDCIGSCRQSTILLYYFERDGAEGHHTFHEK